MKVLNYILEWGSLAIAVLATIATLVVALSLSKHRDKEYRKRYEDFLRQKGRVESRIQKARGEGEEL